jgi:hypothetical protein
VAVAISPSRSNNKLLYIWVASSQLFSENATDGIIISINELNFLAFMAEVKVLKWGVNHSLTSSLQFHFTGSRRRT